MKVELEDYIQIFHLPSLNFLKNDKRSKRLYVQSFSSQLHFKRSIETLKYSLKNQFLNSQKKGAERQLQKMFLGLSVGFNYSQNINFIPQIIYWDENKKLGFYEIVSK